MKEILEHGYKKYKRECYTCGCIFTYEVEDIVEYNVVCPDCGSLVQHYPSDKVRGSQYESN